MKAIVIGTRKIITIEPNIGYPGGYVGSDGHHYHDHELQLVVNDDPDYWTRLEHQYAGLAMQGILSNPIGFEEVRKYAEQQDCDIISLIVGASEEYATALVKKMKDE